jgi:hypothetical protein
VLVYFVAPSCCAEHNQQRLKKRKPLISQGLCRGTRIRTWDPPDFNRDALPDCGQLLLSVKKVVFVLFINKFLVPEFFEIQLESVGFKIAIEIL